MAEPAESIETRNPTHGGGRLLPEGFQLRVQAELPELHGPRARACEVTASASMGVSGPIYALVYDTLFPLPLARMERLGGLDIPNFPEIIAHGKIPSSIAGKEAYALILYRPYGTPLRRFLEKGKPLDEETLIQRVLRPLYQLLLQLEDIGVCHGVVNPDMIYLDEQENRLFLREPYSQFPGEAQHPAYETLNRLLCHPTGKGLGDATVDAHAMGVLLFALISGTQPFAGEDAHAVLEARLQKGTFDAIADEVRKKGSITISARMENLLKGLLHDTDEERLSMEDIERWLMRTEKRATRSKMHRQAAMSFLFDEEEHYSVKRLVHHIYEKWDVARQSLNLQELGRWASLSLRDNELGEALDRIYQSSRAEMMISDQRLIRLILMLDSSGPLRFRTCAANLSGMNHFLASSYLEHEDNQLQHVATLIGEGYADVWRQAQPDPKTLTTSIVGWSLPRTRQFIRKSGLGFGVERALYETNPGLPCQSPLVDGYYIITLPDLLYALEKIAQKGVPDADPVDRHIAAFIASRIDLSEEMRVRTLQNFPFIGKHPVLLATGLLTVAQSESGIKTLPGLTKWLAARLDVLQELLNSNFIRKEIKQKIKEVAAKGNVSTLFRIVSDPAYVKRDLYGFHEARRQYQQIGYQIHQLKHVSTLQQMAYQLGLRIAVTLSYLVCMIALVYVVFLTS